MVNDIKSFLQLWNNKLLYLKMHIFTYNNAYACKYGCICTRLSIYMHSIYVHICMCINMDVCVSSLSCADNPKSLTLSRYLWLLLIARGKSSSLCPVSAQSWYIQVFVRWTELSCPCVRVHKRTLLMNFSLFLLYAAFLVRHIRIVWEMGGKWSYSYCLLGTASKTRS